MNPPAHDPPVLPVIPARSLKGQLILWLVLLLTLMALLSSALSFFLSLGEANTLMDHQLIHIARSVDEGSQLAAMRRRFRSENSLEQQEDFVIQVWMNGLPVRTSRPDFNLPRAPGTGFSDLELPNGQDDGHWRAYTVYYPDRVVQISQAERVRLDIAIHSALRELMPGLIMIPLSWIMIGLIVSRLMKPVELITQAAVNRDINSLAPLPADNIPAEIAPLINAINSMVYKLSQALSAQRAFLSDAAHELRTPLAALQLQIDTLKQSPSPQEFDSRIQDMQRGIQRASHLVGQLLRISRYEAQAHPPERQVILLNNLVKEIIADFVPLAGLRHIDLGMTNDEPGCIMGNPEDIRILLGNLIDNAIRYTSSNGKVDIAVSADPGHIRVSICDTGTGIPDALLPRVFDRFFRAAGQGTEGSGIGLAIVKTIAERESVVLRLENRTDRNGLIATCLFNACSCNQISSHCNNPVTPTSF